MRYRAIQKILGTLLGLFSFTLVPPLLISWWTRDGATDAFAIGAAAIAIAGFALAVPVRNTREDLKLRDGFIVVVLFWVVLGCSGAIPLILAESLRMPIVDAMFESISGLTTTGATVITGLDDLPASVLFYRQLLQWLGGMGIIVLAVAVLPMLGIGGMQLYRAETPGPVKDTRLTPRITETAKALWYIYLTMTVSCTLAYFAAGMSWFDAICHSFSTVAIGGFSTHDASIGYFHNATIEAICVVFMFLAAINFSLHFVAWKKRSVSPYVEDTEFKAYAGLLSVVCISCVIGLSVSGYMEDAGEAIRSAVFHAISIGTTTGFATTTYQDWPRSLPVMLLFASFVGGCAGSTGGGLKVVRIVLLYKQGLREVRRLIHPNAVMSIKMAGRPVPYRVVDAVWG
ncbi:MAG: potassium transporter, partial [Gammaproteobacteria bacterium]|nr:potassium transporter [Gammaproteobacteria bacterium]